MRSLYIMATDRSGRVCPRRSRLLNPYGGSSSVEDYNPDAYCPEDLGVDTDFYAAGGGGYPAGGEFWWQVADRGRLAKWYDSRHVRQLADKVGLNSPPAYPGEDRTQRHLAELVGAHVGPFASTVSPAFRKGMLRENLRSRRDSQTAAQVNGCLSGGCGLGTIWTDPRFEPPPPVLFHGDDAVWAHGGHAGGPTFGSFTPASFPLSGTWRRYVHGFDASSSA